MYKRSRDENFVFFMKFWVSAIDEAKWRLICQRDEKKSLNSDQKSSKFQWQPFIWKINWDSNLLSIFRSFFCQFFQKKKIDAPYSSQTSQKQHPFQPLQSKLSNEKKWAPPNPIKAPQKQHLLQSGSKMSTFDFYNLRKFTPL